MINGELRSALDAQVDLALIESMAARDAPSRARARRLRTEVLMSLADLESRIAGYRLLLAMFPIPLEQSTLIPMDTIPPSFELN